MRGHTQRNCVKCSAEFITYSPTQKYCSQPCSIASRNRKNWHNYENRKCPHCAQTFRIISWRRSVFCTHKCSSDSRRGKPNGRQIPQHKLRHKRVARILIDGKAKFLHRHLVEQSIGRELLRSETVHHIDCDSFNNVIENLYLCKDEQAHQLAHSSIERLVRQLLDMNVIEFHEGRYRLTPTALAVAITASET